MGHEYMSPVEFLLTAMITEKDEELVMSLDPDLLRKAFTHPTNKRLAWLGDSVIELAITEHLYLTTEQPAANLDLARQEIIRNDNLKESVAKRFYLKSKILVPRWERDPEAREILAAAFEALTCAIFMKKGFEVAAGFVCRTLLGQTPPEAADPA